MSPTDYDAWQSIEGRLGRFEDKIDRLVLTMTEAIKTTYEPLDIRVRSVTEEVAGLKGVREELSKLRDEISEMRGVKKSRELFLPGIIAALIGGIVAVTDILTR